MSVPIECVAVPVKKTMNRFTIEMNTFFNVHMLEKLWLYVDCIQHLRDLLTSLALGVPGIPLCGFFLQKKNCSKFYS